MFSSNIVKKPVLAWVITLSIVVLGLVAWQKIPIRQYPHMTYPILTVTTEFRGASPEIVEKQITLPLEKALAGLENLDTISSASRSEESEIWLTFKPGVSMDSAASEIRDRVARVDDWPENIRDPKILKAQSSATPTMRLVVHSTSLNVHELRDYLERNLIKEFESVSGVATIYVYGGGRYEMQIFLDPVRLAAYEMTAQHVSDVLRKQNIQSPAGRLHTCNQDILITTHAPLATPKEFSQLVLGEKKGHIIRLSDVAHVAFNPTQEGFRARYYSAASGKKYALNSDNQAAAVMSVLPQPHANPMDISKDVRLKAAELSKNLPQGMHLDVASDSSIFIKNSIDEVYKTVLEAIILVVGVLIFFLRSWTAPLVPLITIPVSFLGTLPILYMLGCSLNIFTLFAFVLAVGLVVDDAIVVLENIYRLIEKGLSPFKASIEGMKQIQFSVIAMTLTLVAVYAPIMLSSGITGRFFSEFAIALAGAVLISGVVALTLSPVMCARLLRPSHPSLEGAPRWSNRMLHRVDQAYSYFLELCLRWRSVSLGISYGLACLGFFAGYMFVKSELAPKEDQGRFYVGIQSPFGSTLDYVDKYMLEVEKRLANSPEVEKFTSVNQSGGESYILGDLIHWQHRNRSCEAIVADIKESLKGLSGIEAYVRASGSSLGGGGDQPQVVFFVQSDKSYDDLVEFIKPLRWQIIPSHPAVYAVQWDVEARGLEYAVEVNRDKASVLGISPENIAFSLSILVQGKPFSKFERDNKQYPVRLWAEEAYRRDIKDILSFPIRRDNKKISVPLEDFISIKEVNSATGIHHTSGKPSVELKIWLKPGFGVGQSYYELLDLIEKQLPQGYSIKIGGELKRFVEEQYNIYFVFALAIAFIFFVMAAQFESFVDPFIILLSVPLALAGGFACLWLIPGCTLNIYSQIGFITLIGLISKHGILIVDFANQLRLPSNNKDKSDFVEALSAGEAVFKAAQMRLRPILMTTFAMALGALPLAMSSGPGSESRRQIGVVICGGISFGTLFTLIVIPVLYTLFSRRHRYEAET